MTTIYRFKLPKAGVRKRYGFEKRNEPADYRLLHAVADEALPEATKVALTALTRLRASVTLETLQGLYALQHEHGIEQAIDFAGLADDLAGLDPVLARVAQRAAAAAVRLLPTTGVQKAEGDDAFAGGSATMSLGMRFDLINDHAVEWAQQHAGELVTSVSENTRQAIRQIVVDMFVRGTPPGEAAGQIKSVIGLTPGDVRAVSNYRDLLDRLNDREGLSDAVKERLRRAGLNAGDIEQIAGSHLSKAQIDGLAKRYADHLLSQRAETIARTESIRASVKGQQLLWQEAEANGYLEPGRWVRVWLITFDDRTCPTCQGMSGKQSAGLKGPYEGGYDGPPLHPRCRCAEYIEQVERHGA